MLEDVGAENVARIGNRKERRGVKTLDEAFKSVPSLVSHLKKLTAYKERADGELLRLRKEITKMRIANAEVSAQNAELQFKVDELSEKLAERKRTLKGQHASTQTKSQASSFNLQNFDDSYSEDELSMHSAIKDASILTSGSAEKMSTPNTHASENNEEDGDRAREEEGDVLLDGGITPIALIRDSESFQLAGSGKSILDKLSATSRRDVMIKFRSMNGTWSERKPPRAADDRLGFRSARKDRADNLRKTLLRGSPRNLFSASSPRRRESPQ